MSKSSQKLNAFPASLKAALMMTLLLFCLPALAIEESSADELITMNMRNADISAVIQWIAEQTNKKIVVDPRIKGKVTVLANEPMTIEQAYQVFLAMLDVYGYAATESGGILRIFPAAMMKSSPSEVIGAFDQLNGEEQILYVVKVELVSASEISKLIKPLVAPSGYIAAFPGSNSIILADDAQNVKRLVQLIQQLDKGGNLEFETIQLKYAAVKDVVGLVESLIKPDAKSAFSVTGDERSNTLMMAGDSGTKSKVRKLVLQLDQPVSSAGNTRVVYLHYISAEELLPILKGMTDAIKEDNKQADIASSSISIEASESANALIMTAPLDVLQSMQKVIDQIDVRQSQVLVEAIIVDVSQAAVETIGVEWNTSLSSFDGTEALTNFGLKALSLDPVTGSLINQGLNLGVYRNGSLRVLLQALATETKANILSTPSIITLNNQEAEILVGQNIPLKTGSTTNSASSTDNPFITIERQDIGLSLKITPQINDTDSITLDILQEIETIDTSEISAEDIVTNKRSIRTKVLVKNNAILVLGGLVSDDSETVVKKIPFFGDLPYVGALFRSTTEQKVKRNLMVFIHPVILDTDETTRSITEKNYQMMDGLREQYSRDELTNEALKMKDFTEYTPRPAKSSSSK
jgi:general secretion pathway protein D